MGLSPTTHILKPDTRQPRHQPSAINESACMRLASTLKLPASDVWLLRVPEAAHMMQRYDRLNVAGNIVALHQIDGCQLLGHGPAGSIRASAVLPASQSWWRHCALCRCVAQTCCNYSAG